MATKQPRKVALINVADYPRGKYSAHWHIVVSGSEEEGYRWQATITSFAPIGWSFEGKTTKERPDVPMPVYPSDVPITQAQYLQMDGAGQSRVRALQDERRTLCAAVYEASPKPQFQLAEEIGVSDTRDEADTAAQQWVLAQMVSHKRPEKPVNPQNGHAMVGFLTGGWILDALFEGLRRLLSPLIFALAYSTTVRNNRMTQILNAIDGGAGAGLWRIYDGSRPATCGTATTLLAELTLSDPSGSVASQALTFSAITADAAANASGTATWFRVVDSTGTCCVDGNVGTSGSDLNLNSTAISVGQEVSITSAVITEGNA